MNVSNNQSEYFDLPFSNADLDTSNPNYNVMKIRSTVGKIDLNGYEAWLTELTFGNSVPNFPNSAVTFTLNIPTSTGTNAVTCTIPANSSLYIDDFNNLLKYYSELNNFYLVDSGGNKFYFVSAVFNRTANKTDLEFINVPTSLPSGYTNPAGMTFPAAASWAQLVISNSYILRLLGFAAGSYPSSMTPTAGANNTQQGTLFPQEQPNDRFLVLVKGCSNNIARFTEYIGSIDNSTTLLGYNIVYKSNTELWVPCSGVHDIITVRVVDVNGNDVKQLIPYWSGVIRFRRSKAVYS